MAAATPQGLLPTAGVGSYSAPEWLERLRTDFYQGRISAAYLADITDVAVKAAVKDQERAGVDVVTDGELRRDNDVDYILARVPGVDIPHRAKTYSYDYYEAVVPRPLPAGGNGSGLGLVADYRFTLEQTDLPVKCCLTGPFSLAHRVRTEAYPDLDALVMDFAAVLNAEARRLASAGARLLQIDEPFLAGYPERAELAVRAVNAVAEGVDAHWALHVCYGNRYARPAWEGHYDFLFPAVLEARIDQLLLEFARKGYDDLGLIATHRPHFALGLGVIDVKREELETPEVVAGRIRRALEVLPPEQVAVNPDCGLRHLPASVARAKLEAMAQGAAMVREELA